ncbi:MAG: ABC transporter ATP-binding protein [Desulfobacterales bacterium]|jgi:branched-chain amino acid transport system ATP-binding protein
MKPDILKIDKLVKSFNGNTVISDISLSIEQGELSAIIGPNGAGKTTFFNLITGYHLPNSGEIYFEGKSIGGMQPFDIVRLGIARAFQITNIFPKLSVLENIVATVITHRRGNLNLVTPTVKLKSVYDRAYQILEDVGLADRAHRQSGTLAHGNQKILDIAVALAMEPKLLLLDEPTAGMSPEERWQTVELIQKLWRQLNITMVFIEHDMDIVFGISQKVRVLCYGTMLAEGTPEEISQNDKVVEAYLGEEVD